MRKSIILSCLALFVLIPAARAEETLGKRAIESALAQPSLIIENTEIDTGDLGAFYRLRQYRPVWGTWRDNLDHAALATYLKGLEPLVAYHGLSLESYPLEAMRRLNADDSQPLKAELLATATLLRLGHDLHGDTPDLSHLYPGWSFARKPVDLHALIAKAVDDNRLNETIAGLSPRHAVYAQLAAALKMYREKEQKGTWPAVPDGPTLRPGDHDRRVAALRARLAAEYDIEPSAATGPANRTFDSGLEKAVKTFQSRNGLKVDGHVGALTLEALNVTMAERIGQISANMERWRHMPEEFPARYAVVNIPATTFEVFENGASLYRGLVIVGRPDRRTPFIQSAIRSVIFNPSWHVPAKIAREDILPKLRKDPHYLEKMGFVINGSADDPYGETIDWNQIRKSEFNFRLRQSPGDLNSLGRLKFDFDNDFAVYMHGTPHMELFEKESRFFSSGCIRVQDPSAFAQILLAGNTGDWTVDRINEEVDKGKTHWLRVAQPLPLYIVYWTAFPGDDGVIEFRPDIYDYDRFLIDSRQAGIRKASQLKTAAIPTPDTSQHVDKK